VVALKQEIRDLQAGAEGEKQERRGGIETASRPDGPGPADPKQERRGGIETSGSD